MKLYGKKAEEAANVIVAAFQKPESLPKPLAQVFIRRKDNVPCRSWSWRNQLIVALHGYSDARGFRQWESVGRSIKKGEKALYILSPCIGKRLDEDNGEEKTILYGFRSTAVFGIEQTQGSPLPERDETADAWLRSLPLADVAEKWGLTVESFNGRPDAYKGCYRHGTSIALGVENLSTWAHELVHAADDRNGKLKPTNKGSNEIVAELGGAVLLCVLGNEHEADLGGCSEYVQSYANLKGTDVLDACGKVLERTCEAVALILDTAEQIRQTPSATLRDSKPFPHEKYTAVTT